MEPANESERTYRLHLNRTIRATKEQAFQALVDPELLSRWFTTNAQVDLRKGGAYSNADGDRGTYLEITPPSRLIFTWDNPGHCPDTFVTLTFRDVPQDRVLVRLLHRDLKSPDDVDHMREGWQWALTNLKHFLEEGRTITFEAWKERKKHGASKGKREKVRQEQT